MSYGKQVWEAEMVATARLHEKRPRVRGARAHRHPPGREGYAVWVAGRGMRWYDTFFFLLVGSAML